MQSQFAPAAHHASCVPCDTGRLAAFVRTALHALPLGAFVALVGGIALGSAVASREHDAYTRLRAESRAVRVIAPKHIPELRQESIDVAMELFSIDAPSTILGPRLDTELEDRGLTTGGTLSAHKSVTVGPAAFTSWGILGSTLGHEIEVHVRQSFLGVVVRDRLASVQLSARRQLSRLVPSFAPSARDDFENDGTWSAEREAYRYELASRARFGLSPSEAHSIRYVMNYYYPDPEKDAAGAPSGAVKNANKNPDGSGALEDSRDASGI